MTVIQSSNALISSSSRSSPKIDLVNILAKNSMKIISNSKRKFDEGDILGQAIVKIDSFINDNIIPLIPSSSKSLFGDGNSNSGLSNFNFYDMPPHQVVSRLGIGFVAGYSSGYFIKKATNTIMFFAGGTILTMQTLSYFGYIKINYDKIRNDFNRFFDLNNDGFANNKDLDVMYDQVSFNEKIDVHLKLFYCLYPLLIVVICFVNNFLDSKNNLSEYSSWWWL